TIFYEYDCDRYLHSFPTRRSSDLETYECVLRPFPSVPAELVEALAAWMSIFAPSLPNLCSFALPCSPATGTATRRQPAKERADRSEEHTSELQSLRQLVCRLLIEK